MSENATRRVAASRSVRRRRGHSGPLRRAFFHLIGLNLMQLNPTAPKHFALSGQLIAVSLCGSRVKTCSPPSRSRNPESLPLFPKQEWRLRAGAPCTRPELTSWTRLRFGGWVSQHLVLLCRAVVDLTLL